MRSHELIREQLLQWMLGEMPDLPASDLLLHLAECSDCRHYVLQAHEVMGTFPQALQPIKPPSDLRVRILQAAAKDPGSETAFSNPHHPTESLDEDLTEDATIEDASINVGRDIHQNFREKALETPRGDRENGLVLRPGFEAFRPGIDDRSAGLEREKDKGEAKESKAKSPGARLGQRLLQPLRELLREAAQRPGVAWLIGLVAVLVIGGNAALSWQLSSELRRNDMLTARYNQDIQWLASAERLLIDETSPAMRADLVPTMEGFNGPTFVEEAPGQITGPKGKAALFDAYQSVGYLLVRIEGLEPASSYTLARRTDTTYERLGTFTTDDQGVGSYVYRAEDRNSLYLPAQLHIEHESTGRLVAHGLLE